MRRRNHGTLNSRRLVAGDPSATAVRCGFSPCRLPGSQRLAGASSPFKPPHFPPICILRCLVSYFPEKSGTVGRKHACPDTVAPTSICAWLKLPSSLWLKPCSKQSCGVLQPSPAHPLLPSGPTLPSGYLCPPSVHSGSFCHQDVSLLPFLPSYEAQQTKPSFVPAPHFSTKSYFSYFFIEQKSVLCSLSFSWIH